MTEQLASAFFILWFLATAIGALAFVRMFWLPSWKVLLPYVAASAFACYLMATAPTLEEERMARYQPTPAHCYELHGQTRCTP